MKKIFWKRLNLLMKIIAYPFLGEWVGNDDIPTKIDAMSKGKKIYVSTSFPNPVQNTTVFQKNREYERQTQDLQKLFRQQFSIYISEYIASSLFHNQTRFGQKFNEPARVKLRVLISSVGPTRPTLTQISPLTRLTVSSSIKIMVKNTKILSTPYD